MQPDLVPTLLAGTLSIATFAVGFTARTVWAFVGTRVNSGNGKHCPEHEKLIEKNEKLLIVTTEIRTIVKGLAEKDVKEHDEIFERLRKAESRVAVLDDRGVN